MFCFLSVFQPLVVLLFNEQEARTWKKVPMMLIEKQTHEKAALSALSLRIALRINVCHVCERITWD